MKKYSANDLKDILNALKSKNQEGFLHLYEKYYRMIYGIAFSVVRNEELSKDTVQVVMLKLYTLPEEKFPSTNELSWLYTVTKNEALQLLRKEKHTESLEGLQLPLPKSEIDDFIDMQNFYAIISELNDKQRKIVSLKLLGDMTHKQIGELLDMKTSTVQWIYNTAILQLRAKLATSGIVSLILGVLFARNLYHDLKKSPVGEGDFSIETIPQPQTAIGFLTILLGILFMIALCVFTVFAYKKIKNKKNLLSHQQNDSVSASKR